MTVVTAQVICNGQTYNLTQGTGNTWSVSFPAPTESSGSNNGGEGPGIGTLAQDLGYYPVTIRVTDDAGNTTEVSSDDPTFGEILRLKVHETTKPTVDVTYPSQGATITNAQPAIQFSVADSGSGVNPNAVFVKIDDGNAVAVTPSMSGATGTATYTPATSLDDGEHTIEVCCTDYDGNESEHATVTFKIDTVPPTLNISSPADGLITNEPTLVISGTTNDLTSSPVTIKITVGVQEFNPTVGSGGAFSQSVALTEGVNTITITATDSAGKETTITRTVTLDTSGPVISSPTITPNPVDGGLTVTVTVTITDDT